MVANPGHTCRRSNWLLAGPDLSIIWNQGASRQSHRPDRSPKHDQGCSSYALFRGRRRVNTLQTARKADILPSLTSQPRDLKQKARLRKEPSLYIVLTMPTFMRAGELARPRRTLLRCPSPPFYNTPPSEAPMPFTLYPFRRFLV